MLKVNQLFLLITEILFDEKCQLNFTNYNLTKCYIFRKKYLKIYFRKMV